MLGVLSLVPLLRAREAELRLTLRVTIAASLGFVLAHVLGLAQGYWVVITAIIVMQASLGGSLKAAADRMAGTLAGALWGGLVALTLPHHEGYGALVALVAAVAPMALLAALNAPFRVAPITALIVLLPTGAAAPASPLLYALERIAEIALGNGVGILVALAVLPLRAHAVVAQAAARLADLNADLMAALVEGLTSEAGRPGLPALHARIRAALKQIETAADEAGRERRGHLTQRPDPEPIVRTLYRVRHDLVMIGRAASRPLPDILAADLSPCVEGVRDSAVATLRGLAEAMRTGTAPSSTPAFEDSLKAYAARMDALRSEGRTRLLAGDAVGRLYALRFALEQLALDLRDLADRARDLAGLAPAPPGS